MVATLNVEEYNAKKQTVRELKQRPEQKQRENNTLPLEGRHLELTKTWHAALAEHITIIRTSGIRPGRENILVEHANELKLLVDQGIDELLKANHTMELAWEEKITEQDRQSKQKLESLSIQIAIREKEMEQLQQEQETRHFEELERLTKCYDDKVVEIQKLCEEKICQTETNCKELTQKMRDKVKEWKNAFEAKVKNVVQLKINSLQNKSEHELKLVVAHMDKEVLGLQQALNESRQASKQLEAHVNDLHCQLENIQARELNANELFEQQIKSLKAESTKFEELYKSTLAALEAERIQLAQEKKISQEELKTKCWEIEKLLVDRHEKELTELHERVKHAVDMKSSIIHALEIKLADADARADLSEKLLMQINTDIQSCGTGSLSHDKGFIID